MDKIEKIRLRSTGEDDDITYLLAEVDRLNAQIKEFDLYDDLKFEYKELRRKLKKEQDFRCAIAEENLKLKATLEALNNIGIKPGK